MTNKNLKFSSFFKKANIFSLLLFSLSLFLIFFKGLNFGIDFKGGTLIELRTTNKNINISEIRSSFDSLNLGDVNVKEFGTDGDYLIKVEQTQKINKNLMKIKYIKLSKLCFKK